MTDNKEPIIAEAAGAATGGKLEDGRGKAVEAAMNAAAEECAAEGITDPEEILRRKYAARDAVRGEGGFASRTGAEAETVD